MLGPVQRLVAAGHQPAGLLLGHRVGHRQADAQGQAAFRADGVGDAEAGDQLVNPRGDVLAAVDRVFADPALAPKGGAMYGNAAQLTVQALGVLSVLAYSVLATIIILKFISIFVPLRLTLNEEDRGLDESIHGELLYYKNKK